MQEILCFDGNYSNPSFFKERQTIGKEIQKLQSTICFQDIKRSGNLSMETIPTFEDFLKSSVKTNNIECVLSLLIISTRRSIKQVNETMIKPKIFIIISIIINSHIVNLSF